MQKKKHEHSDRGFIQIFKDNNDYNEKTIIGFMSFIIMVLYSILDLITGLLDIPFSLHEYIYNSFLILTLGSFGISGLERFSPAAKAEAEADLTSTKEEPITKECPHCGEIV